MKNLLGLYEKALPQSMSWPEKFQTAKELGFDFIEISVDESDERLARLDWSFEEREAIRQAMRESGVSLRSMCFSGHRRYPLGSRDAKTRRLALELMEKAIRLAADLGIRVIQLAGYDVYYEPSGQDTKENFIAGLKACAAMAAREQVMLAVEIMDTPFLNSITKYLEYDRLIDSPWLAVYPDIGNLNAWGNDVKAELQKGRNRIVAVHVKETKNVTDDYGGQFRDVLFGQGDMDFAAIFRDLKELAYEGPFVLEMWGDKLAEPLPEIRRSKEFIETLLSEAGFDA